MSWKHFAPAPQEAILSFGGFSFIHPDFWEKYLNDVIQEDFPDYFADHSSGKWNASQWKEKESCILTSLEAYLFHRFGFLIPEDNLFQVYNKEGEGLELPKMLEAISSVIEPLGLEVDRVLAVDPEIQNALGNSEKIVGLDQADVIDGQPGLCMINVEAGYSHAFFWRRIDKRGFKSEKFRMVILLKRVREDGSPRLSAFESLKSFIQYFQRTVRLQGNYPESGNRFIEKIQADVQPLVKVTQEFDLEWNEEIRGQIDQHLASLLEDYCHYIAMETPGSTQDTSQTRILLAAGQMIRKVVCEVDKIH